MALTQRCNVGEHDLHFYGELPVTRQFEALINLLAGPRSQVCGWVKTKSDYAFCRRCKLAFNEVR
jgi:hypothetical protein